MVMVTLIKAHLRKMSAGENIRKVKIVVLGDSGVGKSSFVNQLCLGETLHNPVSTVGCSVEVKLHEYTSSLSTIPISFFVEIWDMGSSSNHTIGRNIFYPQTNGLILVHDLTNKKSYNNLKTWLSEFYDGMTEKQYGKESYKTSNPLEYDAEQFAEQQVPMLVVGTKEDQISGRRSPNVSRGDMSSAVHISVDSRDIRNFSCDSHQQIEIMKFIDKVIEHKYYPRRDSYKDRPTSSGINRRQSLNPYN